MKHGWPYGQRRSHRCNRHGDCVGIGDHGAGVESKNAETFTEEILTPVIAIHVVIALVPRSPVDFDQQPTAEISEVGIKAPFFGHARDVDPCLTKQSVDVCSPKSLRQQCLGVAPRWILHPSTVKDDPQTPRNPPKFHSRKEHREECPVPLLGTAPVTTSKRMFHGKFQHVGDDESANVDQRSTNTRHPQAVDSYRFLVRQ